MLLNRTGLKHRDTDTTKMYGYITYLQHSNSDIIFFNITGVEERHNKNVWIQYVFTTQSWHNTPLIILV